MSTSSLTSSDHHGPPTVTEEWQERVLHHELSVTPGPTLLCIGSLHGNEPAGALALQRVADTLQSNEVTPAHGELLFLVGNLQALRAGRRFLQRDLNRGWRREAVRRVQEFGPISTEDVEMLELDEHIQHCQDTARGPLVFLDLHTTSSQSPPFASVVDQEFSRELSRQLPVPTILGMDDHLDGTLLEELDRHEFSGVIFEGGQHDEPTSVDHNEAATWLMIEALDFLPADPPAEITRRLDWARQLLEEVGSHYPRLLRIHYRHPVDETSDFTMRPGFRSFEEVAHGDLLAHDRGGEIRSHLDARVLMPLYQAQGDDGFFLIREAPDDTV